QAAKVIAGLEAEWARRSGSAHFAFLQHPFPPLRPAFIWDQRDLLAAGQALLDQPPRTVGIGVMDVGRNPARQPSQHDAQYASGTAERMPPNGPSAAAVPTFRPRPDRLAAQPALQLVGQLGGRGETPLWLLLQATQDDGLQRQIEVGLDGTGTKRIVG